MRRTPGKQVRYAKRYGTPTQSPVPQGIDSWSGFKVNLSDLKRQWDGNYSVDPDQRNPQDFVRGVKDDPSLPFARPEAPNVFVAGNIVWQDGATFMTAQDGEVLLTQGIDPADTL
jgi:hypothetical protein